jgi:hypothetical protein
LDFKISYAKVFERKVELHIRYVTKIDKRPSRLLLLKITFHDSDEVYLFLLDDCIWFTPTCITTHRPFFDFRLELLDLKIPFYLNEKFHIGAFQKLTFWFPSNSSDIYKNVSHENFNVHGKYICEQTYKFYLSQRISMDERLFVFQFVYDSEILFQEYIPLNETDGFQLFATIKLKKQDDLTKHPIELHYKNLTSKMNLYESLLSIAKKEEQAPVISFKEKIFAFFSSFRQQQQTNEEDIIKRSYLNWIPEEVMNDIVFFFL